jgi:glycosyltransferase involved in cell wall biosynthesis
MRTVLHVIPVLGRGGAPIMLGRLVQILTPELGFRHEILALRDLTHLEHDFGSLGVPLHTLHMRSPAPGLRTLGTLRDVILRAKPDVVHGWMYHGNFAAAIGAPPKTPVLWGIRHSLHANQGEKLLTQVLIRMGPLVARRVERIVFCSHTSAQQHFDIGYPSQRSVVIPNGVDTDEFRPAPEGRDARRTDLDLPRDGILIGHAGRFHVVKNHLGLIRAFSRLAERHPHATLVLIGRNVDGRNSQLVSTIRQYRLEDRVLLLGERSDMPRLLPALDLYVSPSHSEAFPVGVLEAMACGVPAIATDVGDSSLLVGDTGRVVNVVDDELLARGMGEFVALDRGRRSALGEQARSRVIENYSLDRMAAAYAELYEQASNAQHISRPNARPTSTSAAHTVGGSAQ